MTSDSSTTILQRFNVRISGSGSRTIIFAHGFGCDQNMWRFVAPAFEKDYRVVTYDLAGAGPMGEQNYSASKYTSLSAYAEDVVAIGAALNLEHAVFVGHSVSAMIGVLAAKMKSNMFDRLVLVGPSPRYLNDEDYVGGFEASDIEDLLESLSSNYLGWSSAMAPVIMGNSDRPELSEELKTSFCRMNPETAKNFARVTFTSDNRADLKNLNVKSLILQCSDDVIAPAAVGAYVHTQVPGSQLVHLKATGHCPNLSAPAETTAAIKAFLSK